MGYQLNLTFKFLLYKSRYPILIVKKRETTDKKSACIIVTNNELKKHRETITSTRLILNTKNFQNNLAIKKNPISI